MDKTVEMHSLSPHQVVPELPAATTIYSIPRRESSKPAINHELDASQSMVQVGRLERKQVPQQTFSQPYLPTSQPMEVYDESKDRTTEDPHTQDGTPPESSSVQIKHVLRKPAEVALEWKNCVRKVRGSRLRRNGC